MTELKTLKDFKIIPYVVDIMEFRKNIIEYIKTIKKENSDKKLELSWGLNDPHFSKEFLEDNQDFAVIGFKKKEWDDMYSCGKVIGQLQILAHLFNITEEDLK